MTYAVKEIFYTLQGEGANAGRPAVFCRFAGCNLWTGREKDRATAVCTFCDTDFVGTDGDGGGKFRTAAELAAAVAGAVAERQRPRHAAGRLHRRRAAAADGRRPRRTPSTTPASRSRSRPTARSSRPMASTGSASAPRQARRRCCCAATSSSSSTRRPTRRPSASPTPTSSTSSCSRWTAPTLEANIARTVEYCLEHPQWRLSLQTHKIVGIR